MYLWLGVHRTNDENYAQTFEWLCEQVLKALPPRDVEQVIEVPKTSDDVAVPVQFDTPLKMPTHVTDDIIDEHIIETILVPFSSRATTEEQSLVDSARATAPEHSTTSTSATAEV